MVNRKDFRPNSNKPVFTQKDRDTIRKERKGTVKVFDISTAKGTKDAEQYKAKLNNSHDKVDVFIVGQDKVKIAGSNNPKHHDKIEKVMEEYSEGKLKTSHGKKVTSRNQAIAISLSEQRAQDKKDRKKGFKQTDIESLRRFANRK